MGVVVVVDEKGRITIPKEIREALGLERKVMLKRQGKKLIIETLESVANRFYGAFRAEVPEDLDGVVVKAMTNWWRKRSTKTLTSSCIGSPPTPSSARDL